ncbi:MAG: UDP-N-acetylmuramoyl-tripeptide--D-alanyl-D-alanine ligase [Flavobacteriales bacterium]|nr:UDP-N-acetylmuramoyl-tripeptide--D-alanyl-D-alanine ligase [Flavobacteriales bacterium]
MTQIAGLYEKFKHANRVSTDTRTIEKGDLFFALSGENFNGNKFVSQALEKGAFYAVANDPSLKQDNVLIVEDVLQTLQDLANYHRNQLKIPFIGLTGSNGKTTTKELIHAVLSQKFNCWSTQGNFNNHIGVPLTLLQIKEAHEIAVIEMGANHIGEIALLSSIAEPDFGLITNIGSAHLEGFGSKEGIVIGKTELYKHLKKTDAIAFVNAEDDLLVEKSKGIRSVYYGNSESSKVRYEHESIDEFCALELIINDQRKRISTQLVGSYNVPNILVAATIGDHFGVEFDDICAGLESYVPSNKRSQMIRTTNDNNVVLDAYNANPTSMKLALEHFLKSSPAPKSVILGDMLELGTYEVEEHKKILNIVDEMRPDGAFLVGPIFEKLKAEFPNYQFFKTTDDLISALKNLNPKGQHIFIKGSRGMKLERILDELNF